MLNDIPECTRYSYNLFTKKHQKSGLDLDYLYEENLSQNFRVKLTK